MGGHYDLIHKGILLTGFKSALVFVLQSIVVGLAVAFLVVLVRPDLLPAISGGGNGAVASYAGAVDISAPAVANVYTKRLAEYRSATDERPRFRVETSYGSAVAIDPTGYLVTNWHVVEDATEIVVQLSDGRSAEPSVVGVDAETDLAVLKIDVGQTPAIRMGSSDELRIGDVVLAIGNPYGLTNSVTQGIVSATGRAELHLSTFESYIQTDAAINAGNSGGALVNVRGELVGINTLVLEQDANTQGISFAIPVDLVRGVVAQIKEHGRVIRGWMGFLPDDMTAAERDSAGVEGNIGILLDGIYEGSPAEASGLRCGDVILSINGEPILSIRDAQLLVASSSPGDTVEIVAWRDGNQLVTTIVAAERPILQPPISC